MDCSIPGSSVLHCLSELAQTHVLWVNDAIQPSHPLSPPSPPASIFPSIRVFSNESAFASSDQSIGASASVFPVNIQGWFPLGLASLILQSKVLLRVLPSTTIWKLQLFGAQPSLWTNSLFWCLFIFLFPVLFLPFTVDVHPLFLVLALFSWPPCGTSFQDSIC